VPYDQLSEADREYDRQVARETVNLLTRQSPGATIGTMWPDSDRAQARTRRRAMRIPRLILYGLLPFHLSLVMVLPLAGRPTDDPGKASRRAESPNKPAEFKGQANVSLHPYKMLKGNIYRITVRGIGFEPQARIQDPSAGGPRNLAGNVALSAYAGLAQPGVPPVRGNVAQMIFSAPATRVYYIRVDHAPGSEIKKGPHRYTVSIERAAFTPYLDVKDAQLDVNEHSRKLEKGKVYSIAVTGRGFAPEVQIVDGKRSLATAFHGRWFGFGPDAEAVTTLTFAPARTANYRILVCVGPVVEQRAAPLAHTMEITELKMELSLKEQLTKEDPVYARRGGRHKIHTVKLQAGKVYQIDMISRSFDTYLFLEDASETVLAQDDDGGEARNARLIFRPGKTGTYRIVATTFELAAPGMGPGPYTLTVIENPQAQSKFGTPSPFNNSPYAN
jgi:hypothetical protein